MFSIRSNVVRERPEPRQQNIRNSHALPTLSESSQLFLINRLRQADEGVKKGFWARLFRR